MTSEAREDDDAAPTPRGEARRDRIVDAALVVIADVGPDALTHRRVAAEAGVPVAATTYWFESKAELLLAAFNRAVDRDLARLTERAAAAMTWRRATVARELARKLHAVVIEDRATALVDHSLWLEALRRPELRAVAQRWSDAYDAFYSGLLRRLDPTIADTDVHLVIASIDGVTMQELASERPHGEHALADLLERLLAAFLGPADA